VYAYDNSKENLSTAAFTIGMAFGAAYSNERLPLYWWNSNLGVRLVRGVISILVYAAIVYSFSILWLSIRSYTLLGSGD